MEHKVSSRGWCYILEGLNLITKDQFDMAMDKINYIREKTKYLPIDFIALDKGRKFHYVDDLKNIPEHPEEYLISHLNFIREIHRYKDDINFWKSQTYYLQMLVEKIDLVEVFGPLCEKYHIPIANTKGWSDLNSRLELARRYKEAEDMGLKCVLLHYGDLDPGGIRIFNFLRKHINNVKKDSHYDATNLIIDRVGLNKKFVGDNNIPWINNLITAHGKDIEVCYKHYLKTGEKFRIDSNGKRIKKSKIDNYEISYIKKFGIRKVEALAILPEKIEKEAIKDLENTIKKYLGKNPFQEYNRKLKETQFKVEEISNKIQLKDVVDDLIKEIKKI